LSAVITLPFSIPFSGACAHTATDIDKNKQNTPKAHIGFLKTSFFVATNCYQVRC